MLLAFRRLCMAISTGKKTMRLRLHCDISAELRSIWFVNRLRRDF
jgi:hypothetical protein